jgi:hypothetical protein
LSSSSCIGSCTSNEVAPATTEEIKVASYLIISSAFNDYDPKVDTNFPRQLNYFFDEVKDGAVSDASLTSAKSWLDTTGRCPYYINPVHAVISSKYNMFLDIMNTYRWRYKLTANDKDPNRLCAPSDGKHKASRLKTMLPQSPASSSHKAQQKCGRSSWRHARWTSKAADSLRRKPSCTISRDASVRYCSVLYGTLVRYLKCIH